MIEKLERYHGMATGMFTGDECLAGRSPTQGSELCAVVEYAYSLETLLSIMGDPAFSDRLEKVIFNALPATFSADMWAHQIDQQLNQVECSIQEGRTWNTNGPYFEPVWPGWILWLLHGKTQVRMAEVCRPPLDARARRRAGSPGLRSEPGSIRAEGGCGYRAPGNGISVPLRVRFQVISVSKAVNLRFT